jgi:hypothetical protein
MLQLVMSGIVVLSGMYVLVLADASSEFRMFGWILVILGLLGVLAGVLMRRRRS